MSAVTLLSRSAFFAVLALAACSDRAADENAAQDAPPEPVAVTTPEDDPDTLAPEGENFRFAGRWAESVDMCDARPWTITRERLTAPEGVACDVTGIETAPGGYAIDARCTTEGETQDDHIVLRFAESAQALLVEGAETLPDTGLIRCG